MSEAEIVHPVPVEEARAWLAPMSTTFLQETSGEPFDHLVEFWERDWTAEQVWGARAGGRWVATLVAEPRTITVPGRAGATLDVEADALTAVAVNATHRRRGLLSAMLSQSLLQAREAGQPFSILIAAEWPIYGRFGYAPATDIANYIYYPRRGRISPAAAGTVRQVEPAELATIAPRIFDRARVSRAGQVDRRRDWWPRRLGTEGYRPRFHGKPPNVYVHDGDDGPDGLLWWTPEKDFDLHDDHLGAISVGDLITASDTAYRNLWAYLGGIDIVDEIAVPRRPVDEPLRFLLPDGRALRLVGGGDDVWVRLLDVAAALSARRYSVPGSLVLEVTDPDGDGYAAGRYLLEASDDAASCVRTERSADLVLGQRTLASIYLGGWSLRQLAAVQGVDEARPGAIERADLMFGTPAAPWNATSF